MDRTQNLRQQITLYLIRHAKALDREVFRKEFKRKDFYRPLKNKGIIEFQKITKKFIKKVTPTPNTLQLYTSPFLRCIQTAFILEQALKIKPRFLKSLGHEQKDSKKLLSFVRKIKKSAILVGHEPELSVLLKYLKIKTPPLKKGEILCLKKAKDDFKLKWRLP